MDGNASDCLCIALCSVPAPCLFSTLSVTLNMQLRLAYEP